MLINYNKWEKEVRTHNALTQPASSYAAASEQLILFSGFLRKTLSSCVCVLVYDIFLNGLSNKVPYSAFTYLTRGGGGGEKPPCAPAGSDGNYQVPR